MSPDDILAQLSDSKALPVAAIEAATAQRSEMAPMFIERIERYLDTPKAERSGDPAIFRIAHLLAEWRETGAYRPMARLFRLGEDELGLLFGDSMTEHSHKMIAAVYDGDPQPLFDIVLDDAACEWTRSRTFDAIVMLAVRGELSRDVAADFVRMAWKALGSPDENMVWDGWQSAVALLGLSDLALKARSIIHDFLAPLFILDVKHFDADLRRALAHPDAPWRVNSDLEPYRRVVDEIGDYTWSPPEANEALEERDHKLLYDLPFDRTEPAHNPLRHVGRNDPCPCGSGKKFKKCCLLKDAA